MQKNVIIKEYYHITLENLPIKKYYNKNIYCKEHCNPLTESPNAKDVDSSGMESNPRSDTSFGGSMPPSTSLRSYSSISVFFGHFHDFRLSTMTEM
jgi:hypothetical protein